MNTKYAVFPIKTIEELILKIQAYEMALEESSGQCRTLYQLIDDGEMPDVYWQLIGAKANPWTTETLECNEKGQANVMKLTRS